MKTFKDLFPPHDGKLESNYTRIRSILQFYEIVSTLTGEGSFQPEAITNRMKAQAFFYVEVVIVWTDIITTLGFTTPELVMSALVYDGKFVQPYQAVISTIAAAINPTGMTWLSEVTEEMARPIIGRLIAAAFLLLGEEPTKSYVLPKLKL